MNSSPVILALETSCDETAVAVLRGGELLASEVASQIALHQAYGGVVPEVASRHHLRAVRPVLEAALAKAKVALSEVDAFAATAGPGLATSLMIGLSIAKGLAIAAAKPFLAVNHLEGHLLSPYFGRAAIEPAIALVVSGGHTLLVDVQGFRQYRLLGQTRDDAAGEAFDKVGKLLGLPYPAGPVIDRLARTGDARRFAFPRGMLGSGDFAFSFSGLKTSVRYLLPKLPAPDGPSGAPEWLPDLCASFQEAIIEVLVGKTMEALRQTGQPRVALSGGVSCNSRLRAAMAKACQLAGAELLLAEPHWCTDNAAMIAQVAAMMLAHGYQSPVTAEIDPNLRLASSS